MNPPHLSLVVNNSPPPAAALTLEQLCSRVWAAEYAGSTVGGLAVHEFALARAHLAGTLELEDLVGSPGRRALRRAGLSVMAAPDYLHISDPRWLCHELPQFEPYSGQLATIEGIALGGRPVLPER